MHKDLRKFIIFISKNSKFAYECTHVNTTDEFRALCRKDLDKLEEYWRLLCRLTDAIDRGKVDCDEAEGFYRRITGDYTFGKKDLSADL